MKIRILCVGRVKDSFNQKQIEYLCDKVNRRGDELVIVEYPDVKIPDSLKEPNREAFLEKECAKMIDRISYTDYVIALCIEGKEYSTSQHRQLVQNARADGYETITYLIGGSLGLPDILKQRANVKLSFSKMTFPHQLMRMVLCEEIERVFRR